MATAAMPEVSQGLWTLPNGWGWVALEELCTRIDGGGTPKRNHPEYFGGDIVWITPTDLDVNNPLQEVITSQTKITQQGYASSSTKMVPSGAVLFSSRASIGKIGIAGVPLCTNQGFANFVCGEALENHYLAWCLRALTNEIVKLAGSTTYLEVSRGSLRRFRVPIPYPDVPAKSLNIQRRIVARIEALLAEVRSSRELLDQMRRDCNRLLAVAVNDAFNKLESIAEIVPFEKVATAFNGRAVGEGASDIRVFKSKHVYPHSLKMDRPSYMKEEQAQKMPKDRFLKPGDVLMANAAEGTLGRVSYVNKCEENWTVDGKIMILRSRDQQDLSSKWLYYYLWSDRGNREVLSRRTGTAFAENRGQTGISPTSVVEIPVPKPSINAQRQVVNYLDSVLHESEAMIKLMDQDAKTLDQLEQAILERAFRGEL